MGSSPPEVSCVGVDRGHSAGKSQEAGGREATEEGGRSPCTGVPSLEGASVSQWLALCQVLWDGGHVATTGERANRDTENAQGHDLQTS